MIGGQREVQVAPLRKSWIANLTSLQGYLDVFKTSSADTGDWRDGLGLQIQSLSREWIIQAHTASVEFIIIVQAGGK